MSKKTQNPETILLHAGHRADPTTDQSLYRSIKQLVINLKVQSMLQTCFHFLNWEIFIRE